MVDKESAGVTWLIRNLGGLIKNLLPIRSLFYCLKIHGVGHNDAASSMPGKERLENTLRVFGKPLIPELKPCFLPSDIYNLERKVAIGINDIVLFGFRIFPIYKLVI
jgi:hypothetical protein